MKETVEVTPIGRERVEVGRRWHQLPKPDPITDLVLCFIRLKSHLNIAIAQMDDDEKGFVEYLEREVDIIASYHNRYNK